MTSNKKQHAQKPEPKVLKNSQGRSVGVSHRGRITPVTNDQTEAPDNIICTPKPSSVKRGHCKSELIHSNGKTRPIRGENGHFFGSESIKNDSLIIDTNVLNRNMMSELNKIISKQTDYEELKFRTVHNSETGKDYTVGEPKKEWCPPVKSPYSTNDYLKIYRVYVNGGNGYKYELSKKLPSINSELITTLYDPKRDVVALERAIKKYREITE